MYKIIWLICLGIIFTPHFASAQDKLLKPNANGVIEINETMVVGEFDSLSVAPGSKIHFGPEGMLYVKGILNLGVLGVYALSDSSDYESSVLKGISIQSENSRAAIQVQGGTVVGYHLIFKGSRILEAYSNADVSISSSTFKVKGKSSAISVYQNSRLILDKTEIYPSSPADKTFSGFALIEVFQNSHATMTKAYIESPEHYDSIAVYQQSRLFLEQVVFGECGIGVVAFSDTKVDGLGNSFVCDIKPHESFGNSTIQLLDRPRECCSRIIFIPGYMGSRLYKKTILENQLWEPNNSGDIRSLLMNLEGKSMTSGIYTKDILERINILGEHNDGPLHQVSPSFYSQFTTYLKSLRSAGAIGGYVTFPYDWRFFPSDHTDALVKLIQKQAAEASNGQVVLVAHSYGGIVAKAALDKLILYDQEKLVRSAILVGVPETGTPQALLSALHGDGFGTFFGRMIGNDLITKLAANMPSVHLLTPSMYYPHMIPLTFYNVDNRDVSAYAPSLTQIDPFALPNVFQWLKSQIKSADTTLNQRFGSSFSSIGLKDSAAYSMLASIPSAAVSQAATAAKDSVYSAGLLIEDRFRMYSIIGYGLPTASGADYQYKPCIQSNVKASSGIDLVLLSKVCREGGSVLKHAIRYTSSGDGTVVFGGKGRHIGRDIFVLLNGLKTAEGASVAHANMMDSASIQYEITNIVNATTTYPQGDGSASGTGANNENPWINIDKVYGLDITGQIEGEFKYGEHEFKIITPDGDNTRQIPTGQFAGITPIQTGGGWSVGSMQPYGDMKIKSLDDQEISVALSEHKDVVSADGKLETKTKITESFNDIPVGYGSILTLDMQYVTAAPSHIAVLDIDGDGVGDMNILSDQQKTALQAAQNNPNGGGLPDPLENPSNNTGSTTPLTYADRVTIALAAINQARMQSTSLEMNGPAYLINLLLTKIERDIENGNPSMALISIKQQQARYAELSDSYIEKLRKGPKNEAELARTKAFIRDYARLKIILLDLEEKCIALLSGS